MAERAPTPQPIKLAIAAVGGQGGGVLAEWLVDTAERDDYLAQMTSVPGVAQRTGATIYYLEFVPRTATGGKDPVLALYPVPGDVDVVIATELMEAGRVLLRGLVTPDKTALIASTHREYTLEEKAALGDGRRSGTDVLEIASRSAKRLVHFDMALTAERTGSIISSVALGAIAGAGVLPFARASYEDAIRAGALAVPSNLAGFEAGYAAAAGTSAAMVPPRPPDVGSATRSTVHESVRLLLAAVARDFPTSCKDMVLTGLRRVVDYQDPNYGSLYLERLARVARLDQSHSGGMRGQELTLEVARYLALWMCYEDTVRVADLKIRASRFDRVRREVKATAGEIVYAAEFMHPRVEELCDTLPAPLGRLILRSARVRSLLGKLFARGWQVQTFKLSGFLLLYTTASLRRFRRGTLRFKTEQTRIRDWVARIERVVPVSYDSAVEIARCARLIKGYGDTHARGLRNYATVLRAIDGMPPSAAVAGLLSSLREAALADEGGKALEKAVADLESQRMKETKTIAASQGDR